MIQFICMNNSKQEIQNLAHDITYRVNDRLELFRKQKIGIQANVFFLLSPHVQQTILEQLSVRDLVNLVDQFDLSEARRVLARLKNEKKRKSVTRRLKEELREKSEHFLKFSPKAEFSLLNFNYILVPVTATISEVSDAIDIHYKETGKTPEVLVQKKGLCAGEVPMATLVRERNTSKVEKYVTPVHSLNYQASSQEIKNTFTKKYRNKKVVVKDTDGSVIGIIYVEDAIKLFKHGQAETLYDFAGVQDTERVFDPTIAKVYHRYKWLLLNLATAFLASFVVSLFENTINEIVLLAIYMPIVAGMGGNAGTQTLAVMVRGIAMGEITLSNVREALKHEVFAGTLNGLIVGGVVAIVSFFVNHDPMFGLIIGVSMIFNLMVAGFFGALVPVLMKALGKDPATSASIFITTATDVFGFLSFLGLATIFLT